MCCRSIGGDIGYQGCRSIAFLNMVGHHLSHSRRHTTGHRGLIGRWVGRTLVVIGCSLVPCGCHQRADVALGGSGAPCACRCRWLVVDALQVLHLVDVVLQEGTHVVGHVMLVEVTDVAIAQHGLEALVTTHQHEAILQSGTDGIEVGLSRHVLGIENHSGLQLILTRGAFGTFICSFSLKELCGNLLSLFWGHVLSPCPHDCCKQ